MEGKRIGTRKEQGKGSQKMFNLHCRVKKRGTFRSFDIAIKLI